MTKKNAWQIGLNVGKSFAELAATDGQQKIFSRWYWPSEKVSLRLKKFLEQYPDIEISQINIASRMLEQILEQKLGNNVALLVSSGFESWAWLRQPLEHESFQLMPSRRPPLSSEELIFSLEERVNSLGEILSPVKSEDLEFLSAKLKMMGVERVVLNLLHSNLNPANEKLAESFLEKQGFRVYASYHHKGGLDEVARWRRSLFNASITGTFEEFVSEINESMQAKISNENIHFWLSQEKAKPPTPSNYIETLFGGFTALSHWVQNKNIKDPVLVLGLENFYLLEPTKKNKYWQSPWGTIAVDAPQVTKLGIQPSQELVLNFLGALDFSTHELGFSPGPVYFGRAHKPTVFDALTAKGYLQNIEPIERFINPQNQSRFYDILMALLRTTEETRGQSVEKCLDYIEQMIIERILIDIQLKSSTSTIHVMGPLALSLGKSLQQKSKGLNLKIAEQSDFVECESLLHG